MSVRRPIIFGEVLCDVFPDGSRVLGGAPFNVAWHLQGFGLQPFFISRVGRDRSGDTVLASMRSVGMDTSGVQIDTAHPTGEVLIELIQGQPKFTIIPNQAYDFIDQVEMARHRRIIDEGSMLYHGTLIARNNSSRQSLESLRTVVNLPSFVDVNLRAPWWTPERLEGALQGARWAKLNEDELKVIAGDHAADQAGLETAVQAICARYDLELLILTLGEEGAIIATANYTFPRACAKTTDAVDTVGAGDAFSAVTILGIHCAWSTEFILKRAVEFAARICAIRGATPKDLSVYEECKSKWQA